jgi:AbiV family abortive infection protein
MTQEEYDKLRKACLDNAEAFISAAEKLQSEKSQRHISFHLAGLALEEIGKIEMLGMQYVIEPRIDEARRINLDVEAHTHERKLFWALWGPSFGRELLTKEQIQSFQGLAKNIHQTRLDSLYVNPQNPTPPGKTITAKKLDNLVKLARARLGMMQQSGGMRLDESQFNDDEKEALSWFLKATDDPLERQAIFSGASNLKLVELGNVRSWVAWLHQEAMQRQKEAQQALADELNRQRPDKKETFEPKWNMAIFD